MDKPIDPVPDYLATKAVPPPVGFSHEQYAEIQRAQVRSKKIKFAISVATWDAGLTGTFAVLGILSFCMGWENVVIGVLLGGIALNSFRGAKLLKKYDRRALGILTMNQVYLAAIIILYAFYEMHAQASGESELSKQIRQAGIGKNDFGDIDDMEKGIAVIFYATLIFGTILMQGLTALYYRSRQKYLDAYLNETPQWVIDLQAAHVA